ncbi:hypothetical protein C9994_10435 [Marivirga lumbricoides]|uniref:Lipocalin-like domain-containing protein n=1 Tax=Marivirga lumbricoides TaxID=1046115 RepID=A0A2T4DPJ2_9BACT|nr:hypothetical protein C9994_10435 [Marivirga lumbricoides]
MKFLNYLLLAVLIIVSCNSRNSSVRQVVVSEVKNIEEKDFFGAWEIESFNSSQFEKAIKMNFDSSYIVFNPNNSIEFFNFPIEASDSLINGIGTWRLIVNNNTTGIVIKLDKAIEKLPLNSRYRVVKYGETLTLRHLTEKNEIGLSFQKKSD